MDTEFDFPIIFPSSSGISVSIDMRSLPHEKKLLIATTLGIQSEGILPLSEFVRRWIDVFGSNGCSQQQSISEHPEAMFFDVLKAAAKQQSWLEIIQSVIYFMVTGDACKGCALDGGSRCKCGYTNTGKYHLLCHLLNLTAERLMNEKIGIPRDEFSVVFAVIIEANCWAFSKYIETELSSSQKKMGTILSELEPISVSFCSIVAKELPLSIPISRCLLDSACQYSSHKDSVGPRDAAKKECRHNTPLPFVERLALLISDSSDKYKLLFSTWCIFQRMSQMVKKRDVALQYMLRCMVTQLSRDRLGLLRLIVSEVILTEIHDGDDATKEAIKLLSIEKTTPAPIDSTRYDKCYVCLQHIAALLRSLQTLLPTRPPPMCWILAGVQDAVLNLYHSATETNAHCELHESDIKRENCMAVVLLLAIQCGVAEATLKEVGSNCKTKIYFYLDSLLPLIGSSLDCGFL